MADSYFDGPGLSYSHLKAFRGSRRRYQAQYITGELPFARSAKMDFGTLVHLMVLEPQHLEGRVAVPPSTVLAKDGSRRGNLWYAWAEEQEDKLIVTKSEYDRALLASAAVIQRLDGVVDLKEADLEVPLFWAEDHEFGTVDCRCKPDIVDRSAGLVVDIKVTGDSMAQEFSRIAKRLCYGLQGAHYLEGARQGDDLSMERDSLTWAWVVVDEALPFTARLYTLAPRSMAYWEAERVWLMKEWTRAMEANDWSELHEREIEELEI